MKFSLLGLGLLLLLSLAGPLYAQTPPSGNAGESSGTLSLSGRLIQGTADGPPLPAQIPLRLSIFSPEGALVESFNGISQADYSYTFPDLPRYEGHFYAISATWAGLEQSTLPFKPDELEAQGGVLDFPLYEVTDSLGGVLGSRGNLRVEFSETDTLGLLILMEVVYSNIGDRIVLANPNTPLAESFTLELPVGAYGLSFEEAPGPRQRYAEVAAVDGMPIPGIRDTQPLVPNWPHLMRASFFLPYEDGAVIDFRFPFPVTDFGVFVREDRVSLEGDLFQQTEQTETTSGKVYRLYIQTRPLEADEAFKFTLLGRPVETAAIEPNTTGGELGLGSLFIGMGLMMLLVIGGLVLWLVSTRRARDRHTTSG